MTRLDRALLWTAALALAVAGLQLTPAGQAVNTRLSWMADGVGNAITSSLEGSFRTVHVALVNPATDALVTYATEDRNSGNVTANTLRNVEATDSQLSAGVGATGDTAATPGSTGSITAKLRLMTTQLDNILTAAQLIDDDQTGASGCGITSGASTNATNCKASAGRIFGIYTLNTTTTVYYLRTYQTSSAPTCSSATGFIQSYPIPPASAAGQVGGKAFQFGPSGIAYATGISYCITAGSSSTDNTNAATGVFGTIVYK
jgi:hypothetical protein